MIVYWSMYAIPALLAALLYQTDRRYQLIVLIWILVFYFFVMTFGETGGDWLNYLDFYIQMQNQSFARVTGSTEFLYGLSNWVSMRFGWGMAGTNGICAAVFLFAFYKFARHEPYPLLSLAIAASYLIIVVAIGYTRQGVAAAFLLWGTVFLRRKEPLKYLTLVALATMFHASAAFGLAFVYFAVAIENKVLKRLAAIVLIAASLLAVWLTQTSIYDRYVIGYVESDAYQSDGAALRLAMSWVAVAVFAVLYKNWPKSDRAVWTAYAAICMSLIPVLAFSSVIADRIGLYMIALQVAVFGRLPMFGQTQLTRVLLVLGALVIYAIVLGVWLIVGNFAAVLWLPYQSSLVGVIH